jgi:hypothetical protein
MIFMHLKLTYKSDFKVSLLNPSYLILPKSSVILPVVPFVFQNKIFASCLGNPQTAGVGANHLLQIRVFIIPSISVLMCKRAPAFRE